MDVLSSDSIDLVSVLVEGEVTVGQEVLGNFFKSILLSLEVGQDLHLKLGLSSGKFFITDLVSKVGEFFKSNAEEVLRVGTSTLDLNTENTVIREVVVE